MTDLPVSTLAEAAPHLRRPFAPEAIKFRPVGGGNIVAYVDARCIIERLNAVIPGKWETRFEPYPGGKQIICHLTVDGVTRSDVGTQGMGSAIDPVKVGYSDAIKRAAVHFGIGVSIYALKQIRVADVPEKAISRNGKSFTITDAGQDILRAGYRKWLEERGGKKAFGDPLDHGDEEGSAGDPEAAPPGAENLEPVEAPSLELSAAIERTQKAYEALTPAQRKGLGQAKFNQQLRAASTSEDALTKLRTEIEERAK